MAGRLYKLDMKLLRRFITVAKPYWVSREKWKAAPLLAILAALLFGETWFNVSFNEQQGEFTSALAAMDAPRFWHSIRTFCGLLVVAVPIFSFYYYLRDRLAINWRRWLTFRLLGRYFENHAFYRLADEPDIDNPDQRIAEDISYFTRESLRFLLIFGGAAVELAAFSKVLWSISPSLVFFVSLYAAAGTFVTLRVFGVKMVALQSAQLKREADFRFALVRIRENAESIALYHGEMQELSQVKVRFGKVYANFDKLIRWTLRFSFFYYFYNLFTLALPSIILAPRVLSGEIELGRVVQAAGAFTAILGALTLVVDNLENLSRFTAGIGRLDAFIRFLSPRKSEPLPGRGKIVTRESATLSFEDVTLQTPNYERTLVTGLTFSAPSGSGLLIVGPSGCGKSSLLRAMAGLWDSGGGAIERPKADDLLFVPQHAYMILGSLRGQLCYPNIEREVPDAELEDVLARVNLPDLAARCGGFDAELDFEKVLSVGERQRLAMARVLLKRPLYALLDESTSALDPANEAAMFRQLAETSTTLISVGHHPSLLKYHAQVLELTGDGGWRLHQASGFHFTEELK